MGERHGNTEGLSGRREHKRGTWMETLGLATPPLGLWEGTEGLGVNLRTEKSSCRKA